MPWSDSQTTFLVPFPVHPGLTSRLCGTLNPCMRGLEELDDPIHSVCCNTSLSPQENITVAPSALQHEIKNLSHQLLEEMVTRVQSLEPAKISGMYIIPRLLTADPFA